MYKLKLTNKSKILKMKCNIEFPDVVLANFQEKEVTPTKEIQEIKADRQYDGLSKVVVNPIPDEYIIPAGTLEITANGNYDVKDKEVANVNVESFTINNADYLFFRNARIESLYELLETIKDCISCEAMFQFVRISTLDLSNFDTSKVTNMSSMFYNANLTNIIGLNKFNTISVNSMQNMFSNTKFVTLDLSSFSGQKVTRTNGMFQGCTNLTSVDLSNLETPLLNYCSSMFQGCTNLTKIDIRKFTFNKLSSSYTYNQMFSGVPNDCLIIVKSDTEKEWVTSKFTNLTNVKTVDELE